MGVELKPLPPAFVATRRALHRVAEELVAPARKPHNEIALRPTPRGFGTPVGSDASPPPPWATTTCRPRKR